MEWQVTTRNRNTGEIFTLYAEAADAELAMLIINMAWAGMNCYAVSARPLD